MENQIVKEKNRMEQLQAFNFNSIEVRAVITNNEPWFVLKDVCDVLGIKNTTMVAGRLDEDEVTKFNLGGLCGESNIVNESGLYKTIFQSKKAEAKKFTKWVTSEVLPTIRKTGQYTKPLTPKEMLELQYQVIKEVDEKVDVVNKDLQAFKQEMPLLNIDCDELQKKVRKIAIDALGGYRSPAYNDQSIRQKIFEDIQRQIKREFDVSSYKAIKRNQLKIAFEILDNYKAPMVLKSQVIYINSLERLEAQA